MPELNDYKISPEVFFAKRKALYLAEELQSVTGRKAELPNIKTNISSNELANSIRKLLEVDYQIINGIVKTKPKMKMFCLNAPISLLYRVR